MKIVRVREYDTRDGLLRLPCCSKVLLLLEIEIDVEQLRAGSSHSINRRLGELVPYGVYAELPRARAGRLAEGVRR